MAFVLTQRIPAAPAVTIWEGRRRVADRLARRRRFGGLTPQQRRERYVSLMGVGLVSG